MGDNAVDLATMKILFWCDQKVLCLDQDIKSFICNFPNTGNNQDFYRQTKSLFDDLKNIESRMNSIKKSFGHQKK